MKIIPQIEQQAAELRIPQIRVLRALSKARGPMNLQMIADATGVGVSQTTWALGYQDEEKRTRFEQPGQSCGGYPSLITLGMVRMIRVVLDGGITEVDYELSIAGKRALRETENIKLPTPRD